MKCLNREIGGVGYRGLNGTHVFHTYYFIQHCHNLARCWHSSGQAKGFTVQHYEAQKVADQILRDAPADTEIFFNDDDDATPHYNERRSDKGVHVDGWKAVKRADGSIKVAKKWATY